MAKPTAKENWDGPDVSAWEPWTPEQVFEMLSPAESPWCVVGGWAIDLWLGRQTRDHEDIEVAIPRVDFGRVRQLFGPSYRLHAVGDGEVFALEADELVPESKHQCWVLDLPPGKWRLDLMLEPGDSDTWVCRRKLIIQEPRQRMLSHRDSIPFLRPEGVLLYKAKACRAKDEVDFETCLPHLEPESRLWLMKSLEIAHPGHHWSRRLKGVQ